MKKLSEWKGQYKLALSKKEGSALVSNNMN
jgi:hypothetical protein